MRRAIYETSFSQKQQRRLPRPFLFTFMVLLPLVSCFAGRTGPKKLGLHPIEITFSGFELSQQMVSRAQPFLFLTPTLEFFNPNDRSVKLTRYDIEIGGSDQLVQLDHRSWRTVYTLKPGQGIQQRPPIRVGFSASPGGTVVLRNLYVRGRAYFQVGTRSFSQGFLGRRANVEEF